MNTLSLFDGMSGGQIALDRLGIKINNYYASEINKYAIAVTQYHYPNTVQLGNITKWRDWDIDWDNIDLILAGFPCRSWSRGGKQKGDDDPYGNLIHDLIDIWQHITKLNPNVKFLFENVKMKREFLNYVNGLFGVDGFEINSALVSAQNRVRMYWTNIPISKPSDRGVVGSDYGGSPFNTQRSPKLPVIWRKSGRLLDVRGYVGGNSNSQRVYGLDKKLPSLTTNNTGGYNPIWLSVDNNTYAATANFCEWLQTVPKDYTKIVSLSQRHKLLGSGFTIDVIAHILSQL